MRTKFNFLKISGVTTVIVLLLIISVGGGVQASRPAQSTMMATGMLATMGGTASMGRAGAIPPCPTAEAVEAATMSGTMGTATMAATMSGTMALGGTMAPTMMVMPGVTMAGCTVTASFGSPEVPPGDPKATGTVTLQLSRPASGPGEVCFNIQVSGIKLPATGSHIHKGAAGTSGPIVVPFSPPDASGKAMGCTQNVDPALVEDILTYPSNYYVNVHNSDFPSGAARAQLGQ
jgi:CHRD domain